MGWNGQERRGKKRYAVSESTVRFAPGSALSFLKPYSGRYILTDLSESGMGFMCGEPLKEGDLLKVQVETPNLSKSWSCKGKVAWVRKSGTDEAWRVGFAILKLGDGDAACLKHLLDKSILSKQEVSTSLFLKKIKRL